MGQNGPQCQHLCIFDIKSLLLLGLDFPPLFTLSHIHQHSVHLQILTFFWSIRICLIIMNLLTLAGLLSCLVSHHLKSSLTSSSPVKSLVTFNNSPILTSLSHIFSAQLFFLSLFFLGISQFPSLTLILSLLVSICDSGNCSTNSFTSITSSTFSHSPLLPPLMTLIQNTFSNYMLFTFKID